MILRKKDKVRKVKDDASASFLKGLFQGGWKIDSEISESLDQLDAEAKEAADAVKAEVKEPVKAEVKKTPVKKTVKKETTKKVSVNE